ncbi:hypothetical protein ACH4L5_34645 [Streptomyces sp. NPDC017405]|uniref:hypothetical protein n=1 Tax=unclassified Streptomyces TaxID=2593676 RepID=UPI00379B683F
MHGVVGALGGRTASSDYPLTATLAAAHAVAGTVTRALTLGRGEVPALLLTGKVADLRRSGGVAHVLLEDTGGDDGRLLRLEARSEFLAVWRTAPVALWYPT